MSEKPAHLGGEFAAQFADRAIVAAYPARPPYPDETFAILESLVPAGGKRALELGCGSGDLTFGLAARVEALDALDVSAPMLEAARARAGARHPNVTWILGSAESFAPTATYSLAVAGESLHWMDWDVVLPACASWLEPGGVLAIAHRVELDVPWRDELQRLIREHSTNRDYRPYDMLGHFAQHGLFRETGRRVTKPVAFAQTVEAYVESFHSRNGFSRERMTAESAAEFDESLRGLVLRHCPDGVVRAELSAQVVFGQPLER